MELLFWVYYSYLGYGRLWVYWPNTNNNQEETRWLACLLVVERRRVTVYFWLPGNGYVMTKRGGEVSVPRSIFSADFVQHVSVLKQFGGNLGDLYSPSCCCTENIHYSQVLDGLLTLQWFAYIVPQAGSRPDVIFITGQIYTRYDIETINRILGNPSSIINVWCGPRCA